MFSKRYPQFHRRLVKRVSERPLFGDYLESALAYLEVNQREFALGEVENCIMIEERDCDLLVLRALLLWSMLEVAKGYR